MEGGEAVVIPNAEGNRTTPSVVAFSKTGERMVGQVAKRQAITNPDRTISSIKREMGTDHKVTIDGKAYTPQEISAMILQKLKSDAEDDDPHKKGLEMIFNQYKEALTKLGVTPIDCVGKEFDPERHNAVMHIEDESCGENTVVEVLQQGFMLGDKVLRFAIVKVAN